VASGGPSGGIEAQESANEEAKVAGSGSASKQRTPVKGSVRGAIKALVKEGALETKEQNGKLGQMERTEVEMKVTDAPLKSDLLHLTGARNEPRQEQ
jgi:ribosomal protein L3